MFEGKEAVLSEDRNVYADLLSGARTRAAGRLLASDLLIPLPVWAPTKWVAQLKVDIIHDGEYDPDLGLIDIPSEPSNPNQWYDSGAVL